MASSQPHEIVGPPRFTDDSALRDRLRGKRVLVTGADGFLGTNTVRGLEAMGVATSIVSRRPKPEHMFATGRFIQGDLMDPAVAERAVADHDIVFDLLGYPTLSPSSPAPQRELEQEFIPHLNLFMACAKSAAKPVVMLCSTRLVYGAPDYLPVDEVHPVRARSYYAAHKVLLEQYLQVLHQTEGLGSMVFRLSSPYGPFAPMRRGSYGVLNMFMQMALRGETIKIFGEGDQERDYVYVDDVIHAFLSAVVEPKCVGETFNFGDDQSISLKEAATTIASIAGKSKVEHVPWPSVERSMETGTYRSDLTKLRSMIPQRDPLSFHEGVKLTMGYLEQAVVEPSP